MPVLGHPSLEESYPSLANWSSSGPSRVKSKVGRGGAPAREISFVSLVAYGPKVSDSGLAMGGYSFWNQAVCFPTVGLLLWLKQGLCTSWVFCLQRSSPLCTSRVPSLFSSLGSNVAFSGRPSLFYQFKIALLLTIFALYGLFYFVLFHGIYHPLMYQLIWLFSLCIAYLSLPSLEAKLPADKTLGWVHPLPCHQHSEQCLAAVSFFKCRPNQKKEQTRDFLNPYRVKRVLKSCQV